MYKGKFKAAIEFTGHDDQSGILNQYQSCFQIKLIICYRI